MKETKPIKRGNELVGLSREHHEGLLLWWKIKTGQSAGIETPRMTKYVLHFYDVHLAQHFKIEEDYVFTLIAPDDGLRMMAEEQHKILRELVDKMRKNNYDDDSLDHFNRLLEEHIRHEERVLFPLIEEFASPALLKIASERINEQEGKRQILWADTFWTRTK